jgi:hypothetical protein
MLKNVSNIANIDNEPVISDNVTPLPCHLNEFILTEQEILDQLRFLNERDIVIECCLFTLTGWQPLITKDQENPILNK